MEPTDRGQLAQELRSLAERFARLAGRDDDSSASLDAASAWGAKLLVRMSEAGLLPFDLPAPKPPSSLSDDVESPWVALWVGAVMALAHALPGEFPSNPNRITWEGRESEGAAAVAVGKAGSKSTCRDRAENYAAVCESLERALAGAGDAPKKPTTDDLMKAELAVDLEGCKGLTAQKWATRIGRSKTSVIDSDTWQTLMVLRQEGMAARALDRRQGRQGGRVRD